MDPTLLKSLVALGPAGALLCGSLCLFAKEKTAGSTLQLLGAGCLLLVVLTHLAEAIHLFSWMRWGLPDSPGHYVDLAAVVLAATLFPAGYLLHAAAIRR